MTTSEQRITEKVRKLDQLEKEFLRFTYESKKPENETELKEFFYEQINIAGKADEIRKEILSDPAYYEKTILQVPKDVERTLREIRKQKQDRFYTIKFLSGLAKQIEQTTEDVEEIDKRSFKNYLSALDEERWFLSDFTNEYDFIDYYYSKMKIGPIIASFHIPDYIQDYFNEIRETYALGLYRSSVALCRALLEMSLFDKLSRKGVFRDRNSKVTNMDMVKEDTLIRFIYLGKRERILNNEKKDLAHGIRKSANNILHLKGKNKKEDLPLSEKDTFEIVINTIKVIEYLYS